MAEFTHKRTGNRAVTFDGSLVATNSAVGGEFTLYVYKNGSRYYFVYHSDWQDYVEYQDNEREITSSIQRFDPSGNFPAENRNALTTEYRTVVQSLFDAVPAENINPV